MRRPLSELLVSDAGLTSAQLGLAKERQQALGGGLDTAVLELGLLPEAALSALVAKAADLPLAAPELLAETAGGLAELLPQATAEKHGLAPLAVQKRQLSVLTAGPIDLALLDEIGFAISRSIRAFAATELRLRERQAQVYGQPLSDRFVRLSRATPVPSATPDAPVAAAPPPTPPPPESSSPPSQPTASLVAAASRASALDACELVRTAASRDAVLSVVLAYVRTAFEFVALFARRGTQMVVFEASGEGLSGANPEAAALALDRPSVLRTVCESRAPFVGPVPAGDPFAGALGQLGRRDLRAVLLYPVVIREKAVLAVYGDSAGGELAPRQLAEVTLVLSQVPAALERVILAEKKRGSPRVAPPAAPLVPAAAEATAPAVQVPATPPPPTSFQRRPARLRWAHLQPKTPLPAPAPVESSFDIDDVGFAP